MVPRVAFLPILEMVLSTYHHLQSGIMHLRERDRKQPFSINVLPISRERTQQAAWFKASVFQHILNFMCTLLNMQTTGVCVGRDMDVTSRERKIDEANSLFCRGSSFPLTPLPNSLQCFPRTLGARKGCPSRLSCGKKTTHRTAVTHHQPGKPLYLPPLPHLGLILRAHQLPLQHEQGARVLKDIRGECINDIMIRKVQSRFQTIYHPTKSRFWRRHQPLRRLGAASSHLLYGTINYTLAITCGSLPLFQLSLIPIIIRTHSSMHSV